MNDLEKELAKLKSEVASSYKKLEIDQKKSELAKLEEELAQPEIWNNPVNAQEISKKAASLSQQIEPWETLNFQVNDLEEFIKLGDETMKPEFVQQLEALNKTYKELEKDLMYSGEMDNHDAVIRLSAGVGGTDAQDWTEMLERMYLRWAEKEKMTSKILERSVGEEAGIKSSVIEISGPYAFGKLRSENGVHRLVRLSPFNSDNLRQTSFALVEILPEIETPEEVALDEKELKIDVYRAGGHGGQSVNTTDSAVRITHLPTGTTVAIQNERSQLQNKETALKVLRSKLAQMQLEQHAASVAELRAGESANWGSQIRNYVMHPYTLVKDTRSKHETADVNRVLDGDINEFIEAYLKS